MRGLCFCLPGSVPPSGLDSALPPALGKSAHTTQIRALPIPFHPKVSHFPDDLAKRRLPWQTKWGSGSYYY